MDTKLHLKLNRFILIISLLGIWFPLHAQNDGRIEVLRVKPNSNNDFLLNPGKGWVVYSNFQKIDSAIWAKASVGYTRFNWKDIHIGDSLYNWKPIDQAIAQCAKQGKQFAFGVMPCFANGQGGSYQSMPQWIIDAGAKSYNAKSQALCKVPVWDDPIFYNKMLQFVSALQKRYDGDTNIAFIDNRSYGNWGEWHLGIIGGKDLGDFAKRAYVDMYADFKKTVIILPNSGKSGSSANGYADYARDKYMMGWREDSAEEPSRWNTCANASQFAPNVAEWSTNYNNLKQGLGWTQRVWNDQMLGGSILNSKYSYVNLGQWNGIDAKDFLTEKEYLINEWQNKMGYWFKLTDIYYSVEIGNGETGFLTFTVKNDGVARQYIKGKIDCVKLALLDKDYQVLATQKFETIRPHNWSAGSQVTENGFFQFPYNSEAVKLAIGVFSDSSLVNPDTKLGNDNGTKDNWYVISDMLHISSSSLDIADTTLSIYPNPISNSLNLDLWETERLISIEIFDALGKLVFQKSNVSSKEKIDTSWFPKGSYLLKAVNIRGVSKTWFMKL